MKKLFIYFLTAFTSLYLMNYFLTGFRFSSSILEVMLLALFITAGVYVTQTIMDKSSMKQGWAFLLLVTLVNFFMIYFASLILPGTTVTGGALILTDLGLGTLNNQSVDIILTLMIAAFISGIVAQLTKWSAE